ncbi:MAG: histidinol-phosphate transaminase [Chloroflexi bacterium]|nr:histidinol-phosphate transaminase [Chloroflexota bacterium]
MTSGPIEKFMRCDLNTFDAYSASKASDVLAKETGVPVESVVKLDDNENPYGCSPRVMKALAAARDFHTYPDVTQSELHEQLARYAGVDAGCIVAENGSNMLIDDIMTLFLERGDKVINFVPTFDIFRVRTLIHQGQLVNIPRGKDFAIDVKAAKAAIDAKTKMIVVVSPNSPTGTPTTQSDILELVETGIPVLVDEAYYEFCGDTVVPFVSRYPNLMVTRTFSKWAGIAGIRLGYGIFPPQVAECLMKVKIPFSVGIPTRIAVRESLADVQYLKNTVQKIIAERERLFDELSRIKFLKPFPSRANFIFCSVTKGNAGEIQKKLEQKGVLVRYFDLPYLKNALRISAGKPEQTDAVVRALREAGEELN